MTSIIELKSIISSASWFTQIGESDIPGEAGFIRLPNLEEWRNLTGVIPNEPVPVLFDKGMELLPTSKEEEDPIYGNTLKDRLKANRNEEEIAKTILEVYKATLDSLRSFQGHPLLKVGPHDFIESARGGALFAVGQAAREILLGEPGFWCRAMEIYHTGHWPFGIMPDRKIVVF